jgi:hypothetical protein
MPVESPSYALLQSLRDLGWCAITFVELHISDSPKSFLPERGQHMIKELVPRRYMKSFAEKGRVYNYVR